MTVLQRSTARFSQSSSPNINSLAPSTLSSSITRQNRHSDRHCTARTTLSHHQQQQTRHATLLRRVRRPYTFTQLVTLSDGSAYAQRTTSPDPVYTSLRDARNTLLWNPSSEALAGVESDVAGRLRAFRRRFGRGWDARDGASPDVANESDQLDAQYAQEQKEARGGAAGGEEEEGSLMDLLAEYSTEENTEAPVVEEKKSQGGAKGGKKGKKK